MNMQSFNATNFLQSIIKNNPIVNSFKANSSILNQYHVPDELHLQMKIFDKSALMSISDSKGRIIYANDNFCQISGYHVNELMFQPHSIIRHPDTPVEFFQEMWQTIREGNIWQGEIKNRAKDGSSYWVNAIIIPIFGEYGKPIQYASIRFDITKQKQAEELKIAKEKLDNELLQNIGYAKCIHKYFLGSEDDMLELIPDSFLLYQAKQTISGDFYRVQKRNNKITVALGDTTGHGVSASYISVLALNSLIRLMETNSHNPQRILHTMNNELVRMTRNRKKTKLMESSDIIVCHINTKTMELTYASAKMRGIIIRNHNIIELERDKHSIGEISKEELCIANRKINLQKNDCLYLFSDGMYDQFGGENNKRLGYKTLLQILQKNAHLSMEDQKKQLKSTLDKWKGTNEQTDDMSMLALKI